MKICPVGVELLQKEGQTATTKVIATIRNFANAPENVTKHTS